MENIENHEKKGKIMAANEGTAEGIKRDRTIHHDGYDLGEPLQTR